MAIVSPHGLAFRPFLRLFGESAIQRKCAVLTDSDDTTDYHLDQSHVTPSPLVRSLLTEFGSGGNPYIRIYTNRRTLEYELAIATTGGEADPLAEISNEDYILRALAETEGVPRSKIPSKGAVARRDEFGKLVLELISNAKGRFAQSLSNVIDKQFVVPDYIRKAFQYLTNGSSAGDGRRLNAS